MSDSERPLTDLGRQQAKAVGDFLSANNMTFDRIFSSPLVRAIETAGIVGKSIAVGTTEQTEYLIPGTRKTQLFDLLNASSLKSVLLVGHEPHLSQTVSLLITGREQPAVEFRKCTLASILASDPVRKEHALLQWLLTYDHMRLLRH